MKLILQNGYPYPYPEGLTEVQQDEIAARAGDVKLVLQGVTHMQWLHTLTVEFENRPAFDVAQRMTGWMQWSPMVLEAANSTADGYDHPAIIVRNVAYCGFALTDEV